jgi:16S rRNA (guanine1207-N2)-methyltransferase
VSSRREADERRDREEDDALAPTRASEAALIERLGEVRGERLLALTAGRAQLGLAAALADPTRHVVVPLFDLHQTQLAREECARTFASGTPPPNLAIECVADLPSGPFETVTVPLRAGADSEFAWDVMQQAYQRLAIGGRYLASVDEPRDHWVAGRMDALFDKHVGRHASRDAVVYVATKKGELAKPKSFDCEFAFRDHERLVKVVSRPGVFSHRRLDLGARALIESLDETEENGLERQWVGDGARVLDLGCGAGAVGFAAALRALRVRVHAVDSMPRALECVARGAAQNGVADRVTTQCVADGSIDAPRSFDLVLGNPPYYSKHRIAEIFVSTARRALRPGGRVHLVTRQPDWFVERMARDFTNVRVRALRTYQVVVGLAR